MRKFAPVNGFTSFIISENANMVKKQILECTFNYHFFQMGLKVLVSVMMGASLRVLKLPLPTPLSLLMILGISLEQNWGKLQRIT